MYVYQEYPKCLYRKDREPVTVINAEEEALFAGDGYLTAEQFYAPITSPVAKEEGVEKKSKKKDALE